MPQKKIQQPTGTGEQKPAIQIPDNPEFAGTADEIHDALKLVEDAGGVEGPGEKAPDGAPEVKQEAKKEGEINKPAAKGWAAIMAREKKLQEDRFRFDNDMKSQRHELNQLRVQVEQLTKSNGDLKGAFKKDPFKTLKSEFGLSFNELAQLALEDDPAQGQVRTDNQPDPVVAKLLEKMEGLEKALQGQTVERELNNYRSDIKRAVAGDDLAILTTMPNLENEVLTLAGQYYQKTGESLPAEKACGILAKYWEQHLQSLSSHAAARRVLGLPDPETGANGKPAPKAKGPSKTLTNRQLASPSGENKLPDNLSDEQELRLAAKLIPDDAWSREA